MPACSLLLVAFCKQRRLKSDIQTIGSAADYLEEAKGLNAPIVEIQL